PEDKDELLRKGILMIVADGMGGHAGGQTASKILVDIVINDFKHAPSYLNPLEILRNSFEKANAEIYSLGRNERTLKGMGTTGTAVIIKGDSLYIAHVGDSRAYLVGGGRLTLLTKDHSMVSRLVEEGLLTEDKAKDHPDRNVVTRAVGISPALKVDTYERKHILQNSDAIMLCTDGLYDVVTEEEMGLRLGEKDLMAACKLLVESAERLGGDEHDNTTVISVRLDIVAGMGAFFRKMQDDIAATPSFVKVAIAMLLLVIFTLGAYIFLTIEKESAPPHEKDAQQTTEKKHGYGRIEQADKVPKEDISEQKADKQDAFESRQPDAVEQSPVTPIDTKEKIPQKIENIGKDEKKGKKNVEKLQNRKTLKPVEKRDDDSV
ncbi:MAG: serine/threonine-protein phosphatase, partial [Deltaproteobacteria bacterium]|nr:serine/threonine-protein phosphatase [Deltaproteobacteria bacterium]